MRPGAVLAGMKRKRARFKMDIELVRLQMQLGRDGLLPERSFISE